MSFFAIQVRRSISPAAGFLIAAVSVWLAFSARTPGFNLWSDLINGLSGASLYTGTLAAGVAAYESNRWVSATGARATIAVRSPVAVRLQHALAVIGPLVAGWVVALLSLTGYGAVTGTYGRPPLTWLLSLLAALTLAAAVGYTIGAAVGAAVGTFWFVAPGAALAFYGAYIAVQVAPTAFGVKALFPVNTATTSVFNRYIDWTLVGQSVYWLGLACLLILLLGGGWWYRSRRLLIGVAAGVGVVVVAASSIVVGTNGQVTTGYNPRDFQCESRGFTLCLNRGYSSALGPLGNAVAEMNARVDGTPLRATRLEQNVEGVGDDPAPGARSIYLEQFASQMDLNFAVFRYVSKYGAPQGCQANQESAVATLYVNSWLSGYYYSLDGMPEPSRLQALRSLTAKQGNKWFRDHSDSYFDCTLTLSALP